VTKIAGLMVGIFLAAGMAQAQIPTSGNIFVGYSFARAGASPTVNLNGWEASLEGKFLPWIGIVGDFGATYGSTIETFPCPPNVFRCGTVNSNVRRYTYLFGPRVSVPLGRFTPFAQFLVGAAHIDSFGDTDTSFATAVGGGLDYRLIHGLALRLQGDDVHTRFFGGTQNNLRISAGIDLRF
jgi:opacity protein-like surface antigen